MIGIATFTRTARLCIIVLTAAAFPAFAALGQESSHVAVPQPQTNLPSSGPFENPNPHDTDQVRMMKDMSRQRNVLRQKQIVEDTDQLLDLAKQLKDAVDKSSKDELSLSVVNTAAEIEKLAKNVKDKMRDGD
jgi:HPt (histidine-containing phosphotransfer) domain-containing protein